MKTIAIGSGKGGVGKTTLTANLAITLAMRGARTVAMDADFGLANLDVVLGLPPGATVLDLLHGHARLDEALRPHVSGARVLAGCSGAAELVNLHPARLDHLLRTLSGIESSTDVLLVDVAAGIHDAAVTTLAAADEVLLVLAQDPSSFIDAYATVKCTLALRRDATFWVVVNSADSESEAKLFFAKFKAIVKEKLGTEVRYGGSILYDPAVGRAGLKRSPIMIECPGSPTSLAIAELATVLTHYEAKSVPIPLPEARGGFFDRLFRRGRTGERSPALSTRLP